MFYFFILCALIAIPWSPLKAQEVPKAFHHASKEFVGPLAVVPDMVMVGDPGNPEDSLTGLGAVQEPFQIGNYFKVFWTHF